VYHVTKQLNSIPVLADVSDQWECVHKGSTFARLYVGDRFTNVYTHHAFPKHIQLFLHNVTMVLEYVCEHYPKGCHKVVLLYMFVEIGLMFTFVDKFSAIYLFSLKFAIKVARKEL